MKCHCRPIKTNVIRCWFNTVCVCSIANDQRMSLSEINRMDKPSWSARKYHNLTRCVYNNQRIHTCRTDILRFIGICYDLGDIFVICVLCLYRLSLLTSYVSLIIIMTAYIIVQNRHTINTCLNKIGRILIYIDLVCVFYIYWSHSGLIIIFGGFWKGCKNIIKKRPIIHIL